MEMEKKNAKWHFQLTLLTESTSWSPAVFSFSQINK